MAFSLGHVCLCVQISPFDWDTSHIGLDDLKDRSEVVNMRTDYLTTSRSDLTEVRLNLGPMQYSLETFTFLQTSPCSYFPCKQIP